MSSNSHCKINLQKDRDNIPFWRPRQICSSRTILEANLIIAGVIPIDGGRDEMHFRKKLSMSDKDIHHKKGGTLRLNAQVALEKHDQRQICTSKVLSHTVFAQLWLLRQMCLNCTDMEKILSRITTAGETADGKYKKWKPIRQSFEILLAEGQADDNQCLRSSTQRPSRAKE